MGAADRVPAGSWWTGITRPQWRALAAAKVGLLLDAFDVMLYVFCLRAIMADWRLDPAVAGALVTVSLLTAAVGGTLCGVVADRFGRRNALLGTVLLFSACSGLSGLARNVGELAVARALLGLGMGGEWTAGALLVSETWPARHRGKGLGLMQGGWALGYVLAAVVAAAVLPRYGWRVMFFLGLLPALFALWIRLRVEEPEVWARARGGGGVLAIFAPGLRRYTLVSTLIASFVMTAYWGLFSWLPSFLGTPVAKGGAGLSVVKAPMWMIPLMLGAYVGYISFGFAADRLGRRPAFAGFLVISAVMVFVYGNTRSELALLALGPFVGFFGSGPVAAFGMFVSELFPTRARGAAVGFTFNTGRMVSAAAPALVGFLAGRFGVGAALTFTAIAFILGAASIYLLPETLGTELT